MLNYLNWLWATEDSSQKKMRRLALANLKPS
jgi:hypothetical protein